MTRSAHHVITGYHYQFDKSILEILTATEGDEITLEGVEDVDVEGECIQCKYHETQRYKRSLIKKPLIKFLTHYVETNGSRRYMLYAHFREAEFPVRIDLEELNQILGSQRDTISLDDQELSEFLHNHFRFESGDDIEQQREQVMRALEEASGADPEDCEQYYYGNALHEVIRLSRQAQLEDRITTREAFVDVIDKKQAVFSRWIAQLRGQKDYQKHLRSQLRAMDALRSTKQRLVFIAGSFDVEASPVDLATFCRTIADRFFPLGRVLHDVVPFTVVIDRPLEDVRAVQRQLVAWDIPINTGYEAIEFQPSAFNDRPVINRKALRGGKAGDKVARASYRIRVISAATYADHESSIELHDTFIAVGDPQDVGLAVSEAAPVVRIADADGLIALAEILKP